MRKRWGEVGKGGEGGGEQSAAIMYVKEIL
jgi:hypothetical protein